MASCENEDLQHYHKTAVREFASDLARFAQTFYTNVQA